MTASSIDRRGLLKAGSLITAGAALLPPTVVSSSEALPPRVFTPAPLPFDPKAVQGLSEALLLSHHGNNYTGAVKRLGAITT